MGRLPSPEQLQQLTQSMYERIAATFTQLLEAELEAAEKLPGLHAKLEEVKRTVAASGAAAGDRAMPQVEDWYKQPCPPMTRFC
jgi:hypothetical protein